MADPIEARIQQAVLAHASDERMLLAISGGIDSMVMLHAAAVVLHPSRLVVGTFDHASGPHTMAAVDLVERHALSAGIPCVVGRSEPVERSSEEIWRDARLGFLRAAATETRAVICMAHTFDDQVETVLFRELRGAGTRGLAGLAADGSIRRPLLAFRRSDIVDYAKATGVEWVDDPTNLDLGYTRNRLRRDIIPALRQVHPDIEKDLADVGARAAQWRSEVEAVIDDKIRFDADGSSQILEVSGESLAGYPDDALAIIWPALLGRIGVAADWRGTRRLVAFTTRSSTGQRIQLSGGWTVYRRRGGFEVSRGARSGAG